MKSTKSFASQKITRVRSETRAAPQVISDETTITSKFQSTLPVPIRKFLDVQAGDKLRYSILPTGSVLVEKARSEPEDPVVGAYLNFLERDLMNNPSMLSVLQRDPRLQALLEGVEVEDFDLSED